MRHGDFGSLGAFLRSAREAASLSLRQFARALDYSPTHLGDVERGQRNVTRAMCDQLSQRLGLDRVELYARAGHLTDEVLGYIARRPQALGVLELLAAVDADEGVVSELCETIRTKKERLAACGSRLAPEGAERGTNSDLNLDLARAASREPQAGAL